MPTPAQHPQAFCKLSGLLTEVGPQCTSEDLLPTMHALLDLFGPSRLIWGSDWPVMTLAGMAADGKALIYRQNALRFYRLG